MNKFRNIPALITLLAGFTACVMMIIKKYALVDFLWILVAVMVGFYIIGLLIRLVLNIVFKSVEDSKNNNEEKESDEESEENDDSKDNDEKAEGPKTNKA